MLYVRQSIKIAAYECARLGIVPGVTKETLQDQCDAILLGRRLKNYTLTTTPADPTTVSYGDLLKVTVTIESEANAMVGSWFYKGRVFTATCNIMGEQ